MNDKQNKAVDLRYVSDEDWLHFLEQGGTLGDALDMSKKELEAIYTLAYQKYQGGNFTEAQSLFQLLCHCNHFEAKYMLGLGATRQALKAFKLAGETYSFAALVHPTDPRFPFYAAECHLALDDWYSAGSGFEACIERCGDNSQYAELHKQALGHFNVLKAKLDTSKLQAGETL